MQIRPVNQSDKPKISEWISRDPFHLGVIDETFFFQPNSDCLVYEDDKGPVLFVRYSRALRLHVQFDSNEKIRNAKALLNLMPFFQAKAKENFFKELIFDSESPSLVNFTQRRLGFKKSPNEFVLGV